MSNYNSHSLKLYATNDLHYLNMRDGKDSVSGFGLNQAVHEIRYTDSATGLESQPIMVRALHVDVGGNTTGVGYKLGDLQSQVTAEVSAREADVSQLNTDLDAEIARATASEGVLTTNLAAEETRALAAELVLTNAVAAINASTAVADEQTRALAAEAALEARIVVLEGIIASLVQ